MDKPKARRSPRAAKIEAQEEYATLAPTLGGNGDGPADKAVEAKKSQERVVVEKASANTVESIIKGLADLNLTVGKALSDLAGKLTAEANKLAGIQDAIRIESARLKELHDIDAAVVSLKGVLEVQSERKAAFEGEMSGREDAFNADMVRKRDEWKREQAEYEQQAREREAMLKKTREREQEDYAYTTAQQRKKEQDAYLAEQAALRKAMAEERAAHERDLSERTAAVAAKEAEFADLKKKAEQFPRDLSEAVKKAEETVRANVLRQAEVDRKLMEKQIEGDKRVSDLRIASLEELVTKQAVQIEALTRQLAGANAQVQDIAVKAIEGASGLKALSAVNEIALEQAKKTSQK